MSQLPEAIDVPSSFGTPCGFKLSISDETTGTTSHFNDLMELYRSIKSDVLETHHIEVAALFSKVGSPNEISSLVIDRKFPSASEVTSCYKSDHETPCIIRISKNISTLGMERLNLAVATAIETVKEERSKYRDSADFNIIITTKKEL
jgi:hypothetical protein